VWQTTPFQTPIWPAKATPYQPDKEAKCSKEEKGQRVKKIKEKTGRGRQINIINHARRQRQTNDATTILKKPKNSGKSLKYVKKHVLHKLFGESFTK